MQGFDFTIDQVTGMPFTGRFKLRLGRVPQGGRTFAICLRLPEWLPERPEIFVNGHDTEYEVNHGYAVIHRKWLNRDEVYLNFPEEPTFRFNAADGTTSLQTRMLVDAFPRLGDIPAGNPQLQAITDIYDDGMTAHPHYKVVFRAQDQLYELIASPYLDVPAHARRIWVKKSE